MAEARTDREQQTKSDKDQASSSTPQQYLPRNERGAVQRRSAFDYGSNPFELMRRLTEQMFGPLAPSVTHAVESFTPQVEVQERDGKIVVRADLPGMSKDDVRIEARDNTLILEGERKQEKKEDRDGFFVTERTYGRFYRAIPLPEGVDAEKAKASFHDGVLELTIEAPKNESHGRSIPIEEGGKS
jgi:HSP20 family protein